MAEQVEQLAETFRQHRSYNFIWRIERECGYPESRYPTRSLADLGWNQLPEKVKDHLREMAVQEVADMQIPPSEVEQYLITLFHELERLRPAKFGATSHGIAWDNRWQRLVLLFNLGDAVLPYPLRSNDLTGDPIATAANLVSRAELEVRNPNHDVFGFKR